MRYLIPLFLMTGGHERRALLPENQGGSLVHESRGEFVEAKMGGEWAIVCTYVR